MNRSVTNAKNQARRLRKIKIHEGESISHSQALELVAQHHGYKDWNTLSASWATMAAPSWNTGDRVSGYYRSQCFSAVIRRVTPVKPGWLTLQLSLDQAVDVVTSKHFSNYRKCIIGTVGPGGFSPEKTSNGHPQLRLEVG